jgi:transcription initiation factor IIE alpha subunit
MEASNHGVTCETCGEGVMSNEQIEAIEKWGKV